MGIIDFLFGEKPRGRADKVHEFEPNLSEKNLTRLFPLLLSRCLSSERLDVFQRYRGALVVSAFKLSCFAMNRENAGEDRATAQWLLERIYRHGSWIGFEAPPTGHHVGESAVYAYTFSDWIKLKRLIRLEGSEI